MKIHERAVGMGRSTKEKCTPEHVLSGLVEQQDDAANEQVVGGEVGVDFEHIDWAGDVVATQGEAVRGELGVAEGEVCAAADSVEVEAIGVVSGERVVVAVDDSEGVLLDEGGHGLGVGV